MKRLLCTILILTFVISLSVIYADKDLFACGGGCSEKKEDVNESNASSDKTMTGMGREKTYIVKDPVCGMEVHDSKNSHSSVYKGEGYYFCSDYCKQTFINDPDSYISALAHQHGEG